MNEEKEHIKKDSNKYFVDYFWSFLHQTSFKLLRTLLDRLCQKSTIAS